MVWRHKHGGHRAIWRKGGKYAAARTCRAPRAEPAAANRNNRFASQQAHYHRTQHQRAVQRAQELEVQVGVLKAKVAGLQQRLFGRKSERASRASPWGAAGEE